MNEAKVKVLTSPFDGAQLECDGMTRVLHTVLTDNHVPHVVRVGAVAWGGQNFSPHFWIELPGGKVVDYRLRMWFGSGAPHGVFDPKQAGVEYAGHTTSMPVLPEFLFQALAGRSRYGSVVIAKGHWDHYWLGITRMDGTGEVKKPTSQSSSHTNLFGVAAIMSASARFYYSPSAAIVAWEDIPSHEDKIAAEDAVAAAGLPHVRAHRDVDVMFEIGEKAASMNREAGLREVVEKITKRVRDSELAQRLTEKVMRYIQTRNPADDLTPAEVSTIYRRDEYGDDFDMPGGKELDVGWTNHAEYRTDLRDIDPTRVNEAIRDFAETHPNRHQKVNLMNHSIGKAVVDVNTTIDPEQAAVVTVIASGNDTKKVASEGDVKMNVAKELTAVAKMLADIGIQYDNISEAADVTGNKGYLNGGTDIWYMSDSFFRDGSMGSEWLAEKGLLPDPRNLRKTHVFIGRITEHDLNKVYRMMQGESWSPNGEARTMIRRKGIGHTSMSIGDVIIVGSKVYMVDRDGFTEL